MDKRGTGYQSVADANIRSKGADRNSAGSSFTAEKSYPSEEMNLSIRSTETLIVLFLFAVTILVVILCFCVGCYARSLAGNAAMALFIPVIVGAVIWWFYHSYNSRVITYSIGCCIVFGALGGGFTGYSYRMYCTMQYGQNVTNAYPNDILKNPDAIQFTFAPAVQINIAYQSQYTVLNGINSIKYYQVAPLVNCTTDIPSVCDTTVSVWAAYIADDGTFFPKHWNTRKYPTHRGGLRLTSTDDWQDSVAVALDNFPDLTGDPTSAVFIEWVDLASVQARWRKTSLILIIICTVGAAMMFYLYYHFYASPADSSVSNSAV